MEKFYRVVSNESVEDYGVKVGDTCLLQSYDEDGSAWFYNESWDGDGIWCLNLTLVEEITEAN